MKKFEVRAEDQLIDQLDKWAAEHGRSRNEEISIALEHWLHYSKEMKKYVQRVERNMIALEEAKKVAG